MMCLRREGRANAQAPEQIVAMKSTMTNGNSMSLRNPVPLWTGHVSHLDKLAEPSVQ